MVAYQTLSSSEALEPATHGFKSNLYMVAALIHAVFLAPAVGAAATSQASRRAVQLTASGTLVLEGEGKIDAGQKAIKAADIAAPKKVAESRHRRHRTPPMGWSSWYAFGQEVTQENMEASFRKMATQREGLDGKLRSLKDAGYVYANLDDGYQACHKGFASTFHSSTGEPVLDKHRFPNISNMTAVAHSLGLKPGFYVNNYICGEGQPAHMDDHSWSKVVERNVRGTVYFLVKNQFDFVKVDSANTGQVSNMTLWHSLLDASGRDVTIENCHQGQQMPTADWCPFDMWRVSGDLRTVGFDTEVMAMAAVMERSRPGCWAYPDTIEPLRDLEETRSQLGVYAITSSPLILSFNILDDSKLSPVWDLLVNEEFIRVNQQWSGSPGKLLRMWAFHDPSEPFFVYAERCGLEEINQHGWKLDKVHNRIMWRNLTDLKAPPLCLASHGGGHHNDDNPLGAIGLVPCDAWEKGVHEFWHLGKDGRLKQRGRTAAEGPCVSLFDQGKVTPHMYLKELPITYAPECTTNEFPENFHFSFTSTGELHVGGHSKHRKQTAKALKESGYSARQLEEEGYSAKELKEAGFSTRELRDALYGGKEHKEPRCLAVRNGIPSPYGPMQLWMKPQPGGAVAVLALHRGRKGKKPAEVRVSLSDLDGLERSEENDGWLRVRDIWAQADRMYLNKWDKEFTVSVAPGDSTFLLITPEDADPGNVVTAALMRTEASLFHGLNAKCSASRAGLTAIGAVIFSVAATSWW